MAAESFLPSHTTSHTHHVKSVNLFLPLPKKSNTSPTGENTIFNLGHLIGPTLLSDLPVLLGKAQNGMLGTVVKMATPSIGLVNNFLWVKSHGLYILYLKSGFVEEDIDFDASNPEAQSSVEGDVDAANRVSPEPGSNAEVSYGDGDNSSVGANRDCSDEDGNKDCFEEEEVEFECLFVEWVQF
ncbi:hypothetical protein ACHAXS_000834 [Conticribra weissflogii]